MFIDGRDIEVTSFVLSDLEYDTVVVDEKFDVQVAVRVAMTGSQNVLNGLDGTGLYHFNLSFFLSEDDTYNAGDYIIPSERTNDQMDTLQVNFFLKSGNKCPKILS